MASSQPATIPVIFRFFFLYCEPLIAISGAYLAFFRPAFFFSNLFSANIVPTVTPVHRFLLVSLSSSWLFFAVVQALALRMTSDLKIWSALLGSMLISDVGNLYALQMVVPGLDIYWRLDRWRPEDWGNVGFSHLSLLMRVAFLVWAWQEKRAARSGEVSKTEKSE
jgi:hypothetical protein